MRICIEMLKYNTYASRDISVKKCRLFFYDEFICNLCYLKISFHMKEVNLTEKMDSCLSNGNRNTSLKIETSLIIGQIDNLLFNKSHS
jgi:hypothetical protein